MFRSPLFGGLPVNAADCSHATNESLKGVHTYSGHSPEKKSKSNWNPCALSGTLICRVRLIASCTTPAIWGHAVEPLGYPGGAVPMPVIGICGPLKQDALVCVNGLPQSLLYAPCRSSHSRPKPELSTPRLEPSLGTSVPPNLVRMPCCPSLGAPPP